MQNDARRSRQGQWPWRHVLLTGASSGLGRALAEALAAPGMVLHLGGRDAARLAMVAEACLAAGAEVRPQVVDVRDAAACADWIDGAGRLDLVLANAGISAGTGTATEPPEQVQRVFETNVTGVLNTVLPALGVMARQVPELRIRGGQAWRGQVGVVASLAAFVAAPGAPAYCASKAAVQRWAEAMDASERRRGIRLTALCPGYIRTPMTSQNPFPMPLLMEPAVAAQRVLAGLAAGRLRVAFPRRLYWASRLVGGLSPGLRNRLLGLAPAKAAVEK